MSKAVEPRTQLIKEPKTAAGIRSIPIQKPLADILPNVGPFDYVIPQHRRNLTHDPIPDRHQTAQTLKGLWTRFLEAMEKTEQRMIERGELTPFKEAVPPLRMYDLRHTYCSDLQRAGVPLNIARILMGHESIETTAKIYTHTDDDQLEEAAAKMNDLYGLAGDDIGDDIDSLKRA
ncbi:MAG: tyrosine-type recombinase/integrase [Butyricicoccus sp.]|nr:tyrosine-type recombinase/integrase [Butyricicoccus sp.]